jgi:hypothetical protein
MLNENKKIKKIKKKKHILNKILKKYPQIKKKIYIRFFIRKRNTNLKKYKINL